MNDTSQTCCMSINMLLSIFSLALLRGSTSAMSAYYNVMSNHGACTTQYPTILESRHWPR
jgi:hypothetical protein